MKLTVLQENLQKAVALSSHFVSQKAQLPILSNILIQAKKSKLILSSTNLETSVSTSIGAKVEIDGEITVNGKILNDVISSLSKVLFSVSTDETRPILTGVLFVSKGSTLNLVATDGFRLSEIKIKNETKLPDLKIIIPRAVLNEIVRLGESSEDISFFYEKENNQIIFGIGDTIFSSRVIEGEFPDYEKIIPSSSICTINIDKNEFEKTIKLASVFARDSGNIIKLQVIGDRLTVKAESVNSGNQETSLEIRNEIREAWPASPVNIMFNYRFIEEFLKTVEDDEIQIQISDNNKASKFLDPKTPNFLHIIMPIKTQN